MFKVLIIFAIILMWFIYFYGYANLGLRISPATAKTIVYVSFFGMFFLIFFRDKKEA
jgi:hypothetical protein